MDKFMSISKSQWISILLACLVSISVSSEPLKVIGNDPVTGPICAGPLGPGPCQAVARYIQAQNSPRRLPLTVIAQQPGIGPICAGPLGPAPCAVIEQYLLRLQSGVLPAPVTPNQMAIVQNNSNFGPICRGANDPTPCSMLQQQLLDNQSGVLLAPANITSTTTVTELAQECARRAGMDVRGFAACYGQRIILPADQQRVLKCAVTSQKVPEFANCAAPLLGLKVT